MTGGLTERRVLRSGRLFWTRRVRMLGSCLSDMLELPRDRSGSLQCWLKHARCERAGKGRIPGSDLGNQERALTAP